MTKESPTFFTVASHGACLVAGALIALAVVQSINSATVPAPDTATINHPVAKSAMASDGGGSTEDAAALAAEQARELAEAKATLEKTKKDLAKKEDILARTEDFMEGLVNDAIKQTKDDIKKGVKNSAFASVDESSIFLGQLNKRYMALMQKYPTVPPVGTPERAAYDQEMAELAVDSQTIMQDSRLFGVFFSGDVPGIAHSMTLQMQGELDLNPGQVAAVNSILTSAYTQGYNQALNGANRSAGDNTAWQNARTALQTETNTQIQSILTPSQQALFNLPGGPNQMWAVTVAGQ